MDLAFIGYVARVTSQHSTGELVMSDDLSVYQYIIVYEFPFLREARPGAVQKVSFKYRY